MIYLPTRWPWAQAWTNLPALATASMLEQLRAWEKPASSHAFGLEVTIEGRTVEADIAVYLLEHDWALVLGEHLTVEWAK